MTNDELIAAWRHKLPAIEPTERDLSAFALGVETGAALAAEQPQPVSAWHAVADWLRDNYQDHPTISDLCDAMRAAAPPLPAAAPNADVLLLRETFALCEATEDECANADDAFKRGRAFEAKRIRRGIGTWYQDTFCGRSHMGEPVPVAPPPSAPEPSEAARLYIDGEWNSYRGELLSLALVGEDGSEWYEVIDFDGTPEPWVAANVMPKLRKAPISLEWMQGSLQRFLDRYPAGVHIVADWPEDIERFCRVLVTGPGQRLDTPPLTMEVVRIDPVSADPHNALADARALRDALRAAAAARKV